MQCDGSRCSYRSTPDYGWMTTRGYWDYSTGRYVGSEEYRDEEEENERDEERINPRGKDTPDQPKSKWSKSFSDRDATWGKRMPILLSKSAKDLKRNALLKFNLNNSIMIMKIAFNASGIFWYFRKSGNYAEPSLFISFKNPLFSDMYQKCRHTSS